MEKGISISEARKRLPQLVKEIQKSKFMRFRLLVHGKVAAEIGAPKSRRRSAPSALLLLRKKAARILKGKKIPSGISQSVDRYLYETSKSS